MGIVAVIPARWGASRLPGKPLADLHGLPLVEHVRRRVLASGAVDRVLVATDDVRILRAVNAHHGEAILTGEHPSGTHRVAEAVSAAAPDAELVLNVQGDLPLLDPAHVAALIALLRAEGAPPIATLAAPLDGDPTDPHVVKVVTSVDGRALYFSRAPIPHRGPWLRHVGLYGFRAGALRHAIALDPGRLERCEDLEQLRWLEAGLPIAVGLVDRAETGVDTPDQLDAVRRILALNPALFPSEVGPHA